MTQIFGDVWWMLVTLGLLVTFHEYGHYWVARRCGVKVLRFSVGFGKALWSRTGKDGTEYVVAALPLGGYVKMLDEREGDVFPEELDQAFNRKPILARMAIVAAGPAFNIIFAIAALWLMFVIGRPDFLPVIGTPTAIAESAGLHDGDRIDAVAGRSTPSWSEAFEALATAAMHRQDASLSITSSSGVQSNVLLHLSEIPSTLAEEKIFDSIGIRPKQKSVPARIEGFGPNSAAQKAGLVIGDVITAINDSAVSDLNSLRATMQKEGKNAVSVSVHYLRGQQTGTISLLPTQEPDAKGVATFVLGISGPDPRDTLLRYGPLKAIPAAFAETWQLAKSRVDMLWLLVSGGASVKNLSGVVGISQFAHESANLGISTFLSFLAMLSMGLAILNLLPIPVLDGGHLLYYLIELVKGSPLSERALIVGQYAGLALLVSLMGVAFYNDILRLAS